MSPDANTVEESASQDRLRLSGRARRTRDQPIGFLMQQAVANPNLISLAAGLVDQRTLPVDAVRAALGLILGQDDSARWCLQYGTTPGYDLLRELAVEHIERLDGMSHGAMGFDLQHVVVTTGSQQLLQLVGDVLIDTGDIVLVGFPDYFVYMGTLATLGARVIGVPIDAGGMIPEALADTLAGLDRSGDLARVKLVYVDSYFQNPTGVTLTDSRRPALLELVRKWSLAGRIFVLEDAAYRELHYGGHCPPSIRSYDQRGDTVILAQTFSKSFAPGLKTGYCVLPDALVAPVLQQKGNHDFGSANFNQHLMATLLASGHYARHVERLRTAYQEKLDVVASALERVFSGVPSAPQWIRPRGGLYVWLKFPESTDTRPSSRLFAECLKQGVLYVPGEYCFPPEPTSLEGCALGGPGHTMRLTFGCLPSAELREGIDRLAKAYQRATDT